MMRRQRVAIRWVDKVVMVLTMMTLSLAIIFMGFTGSMLSDTLDSIRMNTTGIDRLKGVNYSGESGFRTYFGERSSFSFRWLLPVLPHFINETSIRGYERSLSSFFTVCCKLQSCHVLVKWDGCITRGESYDFIGVLISTITVFRG